MPNVRVERRLAAILAADIVAYSRLIEKDEARTLTAHQSPSLAGHRPADRREQRPCRQADGRWGNRGICLRRRCWACAVAVQEGVTVHQQDIPPEHRIVFRIGINVGDVVVEGDDLLGDGVNVAARLEALAEPGGICITDAQAACWQDRLGLRGHRRAPASD